MAKSRTRQRSITTVVSNRNDRFSKFASLLNRDNLVKVQISQVANTQDTSHAINFRLLNSRSILKDFVVDKDIDLLALTETWLRPGNIDCVESGDLCPTGYDFIHIPRESRGGGVVKDSMKTSRNDSPAAREPIVNRTRSTSEIIEDNTVKTTGNGSTNIGEVIMPRIRNGSGKDFMTKSKEN